MSFLSNDGGKSGDNNGDDSVKKIMVEGPQGPSKFNLFFILLKIISF